MATLTRKDVLKFVPEGFKIDPKLPERIRTSDEHCKIMLRLASPLLEVLRRPLVGQRNMTTFTALGLFAVGDTDIEHRGPGHTSFLGAPGTGKSLLAKVPSLALSAIAKRFQGTSDALPADITGHHMFDVDPDTGRRVKKFLPGPVFSEILLLDEARRLSPRTQSALLEVAGEGQVTVGGETRAATPFVIMTDNPIESEGTHRLGDALLDRIMFTLLTEAFKPQEFAEIMRRTDKMYHMEIPKIGTWDEFTGARYFFSENVTVSDELFEQVGKICARVNDPMRYGLLSDLSAALKEAGGDGLILHPDMSISGRTSVHLKGAARALAAFRYRDHVTLEDFYKVFLPILRHRAKFAPGVLNFYRQSQKDEYGRPLSYAFQAGDEILKRLLREAFRSTE